MSTTPTSPKNVVRELREATVTVAALLISPPTTASEEIDIHPASPVRPLPLPRSPLTLQDFGKALNLARDPKMVVKEYAESPEGNELLLSFTPLDFGLTVSVAPECALEIASVMSLKEGGKGITSQHIVSAMTFFNKGSRKVQIVKTLAPLASDLPTQKGTVLNGLSEFQRLVVEDVLPHDL